MRVGISVPRVRLGGRRRGRAGGSAQGQARTGQGGRAKDGTRGQGQGRHLRGEGEVEVGAVVAGCEEGLDEPARPEEHEREQHELDVVDAAKQRECVCWGCEAGHRPKGGRRGRRSVCACVGVGAREPESAQGERESGAPHVGQRLGRRLGRRRGGGDRRRRGARAHRLMVSNRP